MEQVQKTFKGYEDYRNNKYYNSELVAENAIRNLFAAIQMGKGESDGDNIRIRKQLLDCTMEGFIYQFTNRGRKAIVTHRTYDSIVKLEGQDEIAYQSALYFSLDN